MASAFAIRFAAHQVRHGGVIAYPTDTVYGLGCDPLNEHALNVLNMLKHRPAGKGLILIASQLEQLDDYIELDDAALRQRLPGTSTPTSWIVPAKNHLPAALTGHNDSIAVRITQSPVVKGLCEHLGHPLVSTSANPAGMPPARNSLQLHRWFHHQLDCILIDDDVGCGKPSTVKHINNQKIVRE